jgi:hypothetical protein
LPPAAGCRAILRASLLGGDFDPRLIEFLDRAIMLEQLSAQFELRQHLARQPAQRFDLFEAQLAGLDIHDAESAQRITLVGDERHAAIEAAERIAGHQRAAVEPRIRRHVGHDQHFGAADCGCARGIAARTFDDFPPQAILGLEPAAVVVDETDEGDRATANLRRQFGDFVIGDVRCGIENVERAQRFEALRLVVGDRERHDRFLCGRLAADSLLVVGDEPLPREDKRRRQRRRSIIAERATRGRRPDVWKQHQRVGMVSAHFDLSF